MTYTTRPKRVGEVDGKDYHFVSEEFFLYSMEKGFFAETRSYNTLVQGKPQKWYYGSQAISKDALKKNKDYVVILDIQGAKAYLDYYGADNIKIRYLDVPDEVREERAKKRGSFDKTEWDRRVKDDAKVFSKEHIDELRSFLGRNFEMCANF